METLPHGMPHKLMDPYFLQELSRIRRQEIDEEFRDYRTTINRR
jgi:hypothetical protein